MLRRPSILLCLAAAFAATGALAYVLALHTDAGGRLDAEVLEGFAGLGGDRAAALAADLVRFIDPGPYAVLGAALLVVALAGGHARHALVAAVVLAGAALTSQLLKPLLAAPRPHMSPVAADILDASWPSGHTTGATALALCLVLVAPPRLRPLAAAAGGAFAVAIGFSLLVVADHYPSDVLGGFCVAGTWVALGLAALRLTDARAAGLSLRPGSLLVPTAGVVLTALAGAAAVALARPSAAFAFAQEHTTFVAGALVLAVVGLGVVGTAALALRDDAPRA